MLRQKNTRKQGDVGVGVAIGHFVQFGYTVSIPLTDNQEYDLIIEEDGNLKKVQCKTTRFQRNGVFHVLLKTCGGNHTGTSMKLFDPDAVDYLFIFCDDGKKYLIPSREIKAKHSMSINKSVEKFEVS